MNLSAYIGKRYLFAKKTRNAINIISWISILSITVSAAALVIVLSAMNGLTSTIKSLYDTLGSDLVMTPVSGKYFEPNEIMKKIVSNTDIAFANPIIQDQALIRTETKQYVITIKGVSDNYLQFSNIDTMMQEGELILDSAVIPAVALGRGVAIKLGIGSLDPFQTLDVYVPNSKLSNAINPEDAFTTLKVRPSGIFMVNDELDFKYVIAPIAACRNLFEQSNKVTAIEFILKKESDPATVKTNLEQMFGSKFLFKNRFQQNETLYRTMETEKLWTFIILAFIALIAIITMIGSVTMLMVEKRKDLKIYNFIGAEIDQLKGIFHFTGFFIVLIGSLIGITIGVLIVLGQQQFKFVKMQEGFVVDAFPVQIVYSDLLFILVFLVASGWLISRIPVRYFFKNKENFI
jgi:lipoprotein-releasing system permease protein